MITRLSDLLRLTLSHTRTPFVPLQQELKLLEHYIALQELRFGDHLRINLTVPADVPSVTVPALLLQPLVENAVRHAIGKGNRSAHVDIIVQGTADRLRLQVQDNGSGFQSNENGLEEGEGLRNTRARLREAYGDRQALILSDSASGGASVTIEVPIAPAPGERAEET
jgi:two-component system LytT family sensor kinase